MNKVTLFHLEYEGMTIDMSLYFMEDGSLFFDGYDSGRRVEELTGDSDVEYTYSINPEEVKKLYPLLGVRQNDKRSLLTVIQSRFNTNKAYTDFGRFMEDNQVEYEGFTWC